MIPTVRTRTGAEMPALGLGTWRMGEDRSRRKQEVEALKLATELRAQGYHVDYGFKGRVGQRLKRAAQQQARFALMLGEDELRDILDGEGSVELTCEFCNRSFRYDESDVDTILRGETPTAALH